MLLTAGDVPRWHPPGIYVATVTRAPAAVGGRLDLSIDADPAVTYEQVPWSPHPGPTYPQMGTRCLVVFDDRGDPGLVAWEA